MKAQLHKRQAEGLIAEINQLRSDHLFDNQLKIAQLTALAQVHATLATVDEDEDGVGL